jgi:hypothetical protein
MLNKCDVLIFIWLSLQILGLSIKVIIRAPQIRVNPHVLDITWSNLKQSGSNDCDDFAPVVYYFLKIIRKSLLEAFRDPHFDDIRVLICADGDTGLQSV